MRAPRALRPGFLPRPGSVRDSCSRSEAAAAIQAAVIAVEEGVDSSLCDTVATKARALEAALTALDLKDADKREARSQLDDARKAWESEFRRIARLVKALVEPAEWGVWLAIYVDRKPAAASTAPAEAPTAAADEAKESDAA